MLLHLQTDFVLNEKLTGGKDSFFPCKIKKIKNIVFNNHCENQLCYAETFLKTTTRFKLIP